MNSCVKYFGGKNGMYKNIIPEFPDKGSYDTYIEPFGGSFAIGLHTPEDMIAPIEIYNDLEKNVYSLFKVLSDEEKFNEFKQVCDLAYYDEDLRNEYIDDLKNGKELDEVSRAFRFFYVNRTSHNGIGGFSLQRVVRRNMSKNVSDFLSTVDGLYELHQRLSKVNFMNRDGIELMERFSEPNIFIYADPPYVHSTRGTTRYTVDMDEVTQKKFLETCINNRAKILISGYDCEMYNILTENGFTKKHFDKQIIDSNNHSLNKETLWKNY